MNAAGNVEVIFKAIIKPSSPTPHTLRSTLKFSFLDQLIPPFYVPVIFFYQPTKDSDKARLSQDLKISLSEALTSFYPFAGKLDPENLTVDCNDAGAQFVEARVRARLSDTIQDPKMEELEKYLPVDPNVVINSGVDVAAPPPLLAVQINYFDCGGIAVGVCSSHQIADAASLVSFISLWADICRRGQGQKGNFAPPKFDLARHFPSRDLSGSGFSQSVYMKKKEVKLVAKRFVFDKEKLAALKRDAGYIGSNAKDPTRVELVTTFIWKNTIEFISQSQENRPVFAAWHVVNLRPRITGPPGPMEDVFGNCILKQFIIHSSGGDPEFPDLVRELGTGLRRVNEQYIWKVGRDDDAYLNDIIKYFDSVVKGEMEASGFSCWCMFPVYEVDYGWGKPVWVCPASCPEKNFSYMMSTKDGSGIEVWVNMLESCYQFLVRKFEQIGKSQV